MTTTTTQKRSGLIKLHVIGLIPTAVVLALAVSFQDLVLYALHTNTALNTVILVFLGAGILITQYLIGKSVREIRLVRLLADRIAGGANVGEILESRQFRASDVHRVIGQLMVSDEGTIRGRPVAAAEAAMRALEKEIEGRQELAQYLVGLMVALGLLGTFIGILETLVNIGAMIDNFTHVDAAAVDSAFVTMIGQLSEPLKGMGTAFSASMFGLISSICLGLTMVSVRSGSDTQLVEIRAGLNHLIKVLSSDEEKATGKGAAAPGSHVSEEFLAGLVADIATQQKSLQDMFNQSMEVHFRVLGRAEYLETALATLITSNKGFQAGVVEDLRALREKLLDDGLARQLFSEVSKIREVVGNTLHELPHVSAGLSTLPARLAEIGEAIGGQQQASLDLSRSAARAASTFQTTFQSFFDRELETRTQLSTELGALRKALLELHPEALGLVTTIDETRQCINENSSIASKIDGNLQRMSSFLIRDQHKPEPAAVALREDVLPELRKINTQLGRIGNHEDALKWAPIIADDIRASTLAIENVLAVGRIQLEELKRIHPSLPEALQRDFQEAIIKLVREIHADSPYVDE